ncbi:heat-inducible transcriptional repressor HrcA [Clostridium sp. DL1XJH146]
MTERKIKILEAIIRDYILFGEPIGSRTIAKKYDLGVSSATIRNEMSDLEELGYLEQLHTSSGRKPSDKGYRLYVDQLIKIPDLSAEDQVRMKSELVNIALYEVNRVLKNATQLLSELTNMTCVVKTPSARTSYIKALKLIPIDNHSILVIIVTQNGMINNNLIRLDGKIEEDKLEKLSNILNSRLRNKTIDDINLKVINQLKNDLQGYESIFDAIITALYDALSKEDGRDIFFEGASNIFNYSEYKDVDKAKQFLEMLDDKSAMANLLNFNNNYLEDLKISDGNVLHIKNKNIFVKIGSENLTENAKDYSLICAEYSLRDKPLGTIGVIGPTRMQYEKILAIMTQFIKVLDKSITSIYYDENNE